MGALYEDVEKFFGDIFASYGKFLARYPVVFIILSLLTSCLLGMGLVSMKSETRVAHLYTPMDSQAIKDQEQLMELFDSDNREAYYKHQLIQEGTFGEIIVLPNGTSDDDNVIQKEVIDEIWLLYETLKQVVSEDGGFGYEELCAVRQNTCIVDGLYMLSLLHNDPDPKLPSNTSYHYPDGTGFWINIHDILGEMNAEDAFIRAKTFRLRFNLAHDVEGTRRYALSWERQFLKAVADYQTRHLNIMYATSGSLDIELADDLASDTKFFSLTIIIMALYASFVTCGGNWVSTRMLLSQAGVMAALLGIMASFGLLCMCGLVFVDICGVMPFLVLGRHPLFINQLNWLLLLLGAQVYELFGMSIFCHLQSHC